MKYVSAALVLIAALVFHAPAAHSVPMTFATSLTGASEVPPVNTPGSGIATVILDPTAQTIQINASFSGLTSPVTAAHIHCCAPLGTNIGVATTVPAFPGFPLNVTAGNYVSAVFDLTQPLIYNPAFVTAQGGLPQAEAALIAGIQGGMTYFNVHTGNFPSGEIRGQLLAAAAVPEPASLALLGSALLGLGLIRRRKAAAKSR